MGLIKKPHELSITVFLRALIYGQPGIGKTTLALSAPAPVILDCDKGLHRIAAEHLKDAVQVNSWDDCEQFLLEDLTPYKTIIVDTAGKMIDFMTAHLIKNNPRLKKADGSLSLQGYGARKAMFSEYITRVTSLGKNIIFVAHEREEKDGDNRYVRPEIGGSSGNDLMKDLDLVGYVESMGNKRTISFNATDKFYGKNTASLPDRMEIPNYKGKEAIFMKGIVEQYNTAINEKISMAGDYNMLIDVIETNVDMIVDAKTANEITKSVLGLNHIWDSKVQAASRIRDKAKSLGLVFDSVNKVYKDPKPAAQPAETPVEENQSTE